MSVYPRNLSNFLNRLSGYNKNSVKMNVLGSTTANQGDIIQVDLPTNSIVDLSSLAWSYQVAYSTALANTKFAGCPINAESIIDRLAIEVNGQTLVNITNYNTLFHALLYMTATDDYVRQRRVAQTNQQSEENSGASAVLTGVADGSVQTDSRRHVIDTWLGFLGTAKPNFIDTSLLGNVRITITLAPATIIQNIDNSAGAIAPSYALSEQFFSIDVVSISDGIYDAMVDQMLASGAPIEIPFKNYFSFQGEASTNQLAFNVASQSIDRLWGLMRHKTEYVLQTHQALEAVSSAAKDIPVTTDRYFTFTNAGAENFHFQVNNTLYPQWTSDNPQDWYQHTKLALGDQGNMLAGSYVTNPTSYKTNYFVYACQLEHRTDGDERFVSGIDTRGAAAQCYWNWTSGDGNHHAIVFGECTSLLRVFANKVLEVVQ